MATRHMQLGVSLEGAELWPRGTQVVIEVLVPNPQWESEKRLWKKHDTKNKKNRQWLFDPMHVQADWVHFHQQQCRCSLPPGIRNRRTASEFVHSKFSTPAPMAINPPSSIAFQADNDVLPEVNVPTENLSSTSLVATPGTCSWA